jgi:hypothetical protein
MPDLQAYRTAAVCKNVFEMRAQQNGMDARRGERHPRERPGMQKMGSGGLNE